MSIKNYTNIEQINTNKQNEGAYLQQSDNIIISQNQIEATDFGDCNYDVMEVAVYDINNNILPHKSGNNIAYIKTGDIKNYLYNLTNASGLQELAIDAEKLLNDLGFTNGILKLNINFVRNRVGSDNDSTRVWIHEISPSRTEVRILPLKVKDDMISKITKTEFGNVDKLSQDFKYYKKTIIDSLDEIEKIGLDSITNELVAKFGNDFIAVLRKDFGLSDFEAFKKKIFTDFRESVTNYLDNKYYDITQSNFGKPSGMRFSNCEMCNFDDIVAGIEDILSNCIKANATVLKRRNVDIINIPKEFDVTQIQKEVKDATGDLVITEKKVANVYTPSAVSVTQATATIQNITTENVTTFTPEPVSVLDANIQIIPQIIDAIPEVIPPTPIVVLAPIQPVVDLILDPNIRNIVDSFNSPGTIMEVPLSEMVQTGFSWYDAYGNFVPTLTGVQTASELQIQEDTAKDAARTLRRTQIIANNSLRNLAEPQ